MRLWVVLALFPVPSLCAYDQKLAIEYANLAGAAYCSGDALREWNCGSKCDAVKGIRNVTVCQGDSTQALVGIWNGKCFASFEGTSNMDAVRVDLHSLKTSWGCDGCYVHRGFLGEWHSLESCIMKSLAGIGCGATQPLHGTGHSLGAAVAAVGMFSLKTHHGWNVEELYNFGMPRMANAALADRFDEEFKGHFFRVTHGRDPFIDMPSGPFYVHVEPEVFYKGETYSSTERYVICTDPFDKRCSAQYFPDFTGVMHAADVAYHHMYLGVPVTQAQCKNPHQSCKGDIQGSWCSYGIACNKDARGTAVYCHHGPLMKMGYGKCHCDPGYCPKDGKCVLDQPVKISSDGEPSDEELASMVNLVAAELAAGEVQTSPRDTSSGWTAIVGVSGLTVGVLLGIFASRSLRGGISERLQERLIVV